MAKNNFSETNKDPKPETTVAENQSASAKSTEKKSHNFGSTILFLLTFSALGSGGWKISVLEQQISKNQQNLSEYANSLAVSNRQLINAENEIKQLKNTKPATSGITKEELEKYLKSWQSQLNSAQPTDNGTAIRELQQQIIELAQRQQNLGNTSKPNEILLASGALTVRDLAESGHKFTYESEVLQILAQDNEIATNYVNQIKQFANSGISGKQMLIDEFNNLYAQLSDNKIAKAKEVTIPQNANLYEAFLIKLKALVDIKAHEPAKVKLPQKPDEVYALVNAGNFAEALNKLKSNELYQNVDSPAFQEWIKQTENYIAFENAISGLMMNCLANIHLKEFEHN